MMKNNDNIQDLMFDDDDERILSGQGVTREGKNIIGWEERSWTFVFLIIFVLMMVCFVTFFLISFNWFFPQAFLL